MSSLLVRALKAANTETNVVKATPLELTFKMINADYEFETKKSQTAIIY